MSALGGKRTPGEAQVVSGDLGSLYFARMLSSRAAIGSDPLELALNDPVVEPKKARQDDPQDDDQYDDL